MGADEVACRDQHPAPCEAEAHPQAALAAAVGRKGQKKIGENSLSCQPMKSG